MHITAGAIEDIVKLRDLSIEDAHHEALLENQVRSACIEVRFIERLAYRLISEATTPQRLEEAETIKRLAVGLRRKLDNWRVK